MLPEYFDKPCEREGWKHAVELWVRERIDPSPVLFLGHWTDASGKPCTDTLCVQCFAEHGQAYGELLFKLDKPTEEDACSYCGYPEVERPASLREFCNYHAS